MDTIDLLEENIKLRLKVAQLQKVISIAAEVAGGVAGSVASGMIDGAGDVRSKIVYLDGKPFERVSGMGPKVRMRRKE